jgi:hypothetical protein
MNGVNKLTTSDFKIGYRQRLTLWTIVAYVLIKKTLFADEHLCSKWRNLSQWRGKAKSRTFAMKTVYPNLASVFFNKLFA